METNNLDQKNQERQTLSEEELKQVNGGASFQHLCGYWTSKYNCELHKCVWGVANWRKWLKWAGVDQIENCSNRM